MRIYAYNVLTVDRMTDIFSQDIWLKEKSQGLSMGNDSILQGNQIPTQSREFQTQKSALSPLLT